MNEPSCGDACDDTSLNGVKLFCVSKTSPGVVEVTSKKGGFGGWMGVHMCDGVDSFITGIQFKSERVIILLCNSYFQFDMITIILGDKSSI